MMHCQLCNTIMQNPPQQTVDSCASVRCLGCGRVYRLMLTLLHESGLKPEEIAKLRQRNRPVSQAYVNGHYAEAKPQPMTKPPEVP